MGLDIRWPIGLMFTLIGAMLFIFGLVSGSDTELYKRSLDINVNLRWGGVLLVFGVAMLIMAWRGRRAGPPGAAEPQAEPQELPGKQ